MLDYKSFPKSESDLLLNEWGYDLMDECLDLIIAASFPINSFILDVATGTGRAAAILSRLGYQILTGDYNYNMKSESEIRITNKYLDNVKYILLNLERIPFPDNAVDNILCINTLHKLDNPFLCLNEIIRVHSSKGKLLIADFNSEGFDVLDKLHTVRYGKLHPRGKISSNQLESILNVNYSVVKEINIKLNRGFIVSGKRNEK